MEGKNTQNSIEALTDKQKAILMAPVFIVGCGRSGTTWLQRLLLEHPQVTGGQESEFFLHFSSCLTSVQNNDNASRKLGLPVYWDKLDLYESIRIIWQQTFVSALEAKPQATLLAEKTPSHAFHMDLILELLPEARFIHIIRDSRSVVSSMNAAKKGWGASWAPSTVKSAAILWWRSVSAAKNSGRRMPSEKYIEVHYEELLEKTNNELSRIYDFLSVKYDSKLLNNIIGIQNIDNQKQLKGTGFKDHKGKELKEPDGFFRKGKADSWKKELNIFQKLIVCRYTRKLMRECGYGWNGRVK